MYTIYIHDIHRLSGCSKAFTSSLQGKTYLNLRRHGSFITACVASVPIAKVQCSAAQQPNHRHQEPQRQDLCKDSAGLGPAVGAGGIRE